MRAGIVAIFFFAALLALGHYVVAPMYCRGAFSIPTLDPRLLCGADMHLSRQGSVLLYFASIAAAFFFGAVAGLLPARPAQPAKADSDSKPKESAEGTVAAKEEAAATPPAATPAGETSAAVTPSAPAPAAEISVTEASAATPAVPEAAAAATLAETAAEAEKKPEPVAASSPAESAPAAEAVTPPAEGGSETPPAAVAETETPPAVAAAAGTDKKPEPAAAPESPVVAAAPEALPAGFGRSDGRKGFDGTNQELLERFRELKKQEGINSIALAQRLLDESTLNALAKGVDPKQHLSEIAHLVLADDPDLKSGVVRGVVVHIAARLKELGVVQKIPNPAKPAA